MKVRTLPTNILTTIAVSKAVIVCAWYDTMFSKANDSIYIEDQFLFQDKAITKILVNRLKEQKNLKIITVGPMEPNLPGLGKVLIISIVI
jgi:phosphatidylserine/phosphatidylglycerophosphate/cardiolipin synthase-like enzyme